jgi:hypothetical protein
VSVDPDQRLLDALSTGRQSLIMGAQHTIYEECQATEGLAERIIDATWAAHDQHTDLIDARTRLGDAITQATDAAATISATLCDLSGHLYDVEIAEGDTDAIRAAATGLRVHLAALRHLTRGATGRQA